MPEAKVFSELLTDLKQLEENGIIMGDGFVVKGALYCTAGDNLGSHTIGGFTENFSSSEYFCRYWSLKIMCGSYFCSLRTVLT